MDKDLKTLYNYCMSPLLENTQHKYFFTQAEYEEKQGKIMIIQSAIAKVATKIRADKPE